MTRYYDYIITGAGCAGMSLLMRMMNEDFFRTKKILVLDSDDKTSNDHTWCFWEKRPGIFQTIVAHEWEHINFCSSHFSATMNLFPYKYKMIHSDQFYAYVREKASRHPNIQWEQHEVRNIGTAGKIGFVEIANEIITAEWIFNSIIFKKEAKRENNDYHLLQHFKGWMIETPAAVFDPGVATFMDFRISQDKGLSFMYVLPLSPTKALVEYTLFTEALLAQEAYEQALRTYINNELKISDFSITHEEFGVIPMTSQQFPLQENRVVYMGVAGGQVKPSSGYAFSFIQKRTAAIVRSIRKGSKKFDTVSMANRKFNLYDKVLLNVLQNKKMAGDQVFASIFKKNPAARVLKFLDNETNIIEDIAIMRSVPQDIFLPVAAQELFHRS